MDTYRATNTINGKFYIGSTVNFEKRKLSHLNSTLEYAFQRALRKNPDKFTWEVWSDESDEPVLEQALLDMFYGTEQCYNLNPIANRPPDNSKNEESNRKRREAMLGTTQTDETKRKISEKASGRKRPEITGENHPFYGKKRPDISRRMSGKNNPMAGLPRERNPHSKAVEVTSPDGTKKEYPSIADVADELRCCRDAVSRWIKTGVSPSRGALKKYKFNFVGQKE
jgi:group I intron endonuclease